MSSTLNGEEQQVLAACAEQTAEIAARPTPPKWQKWATAELAELKTYGPRYSPADWFGEGRSIPERFRVRYLRAVQRLEERGLVAITTVGGRLAFVRLTPAGRKAVAALAPPADQPDPDPTGPGASP